MALASEMHTQCCLSHAYPSEDPHCLTPATHENHLEELFKKITRKGSHPKPAESESPAWGPGMDVF